MKKLILLLIFLLFIWGTSQKEGRRGDKKRGNSSRPVLAVPRTFYAEPVSETVLVPNATGAPAPARAPPALRSLSDSTLRYLRGPLSTRVIPVVYVVAVAVGIPANAAILCLLAAKIRKVSSAIIYCSLAVSDLLLLLSLLFKVRYHLHGNDWALGETACRLATACFYGNLYCSAVTLACISVKRYLAVVYPFTYKSMPKRRCAAWASLAVWLAFAAAVVPELLVQQSYRVPQLNRTTCHDVLPLYRASHSFLLHYNLVLTVLGLLAPLVVTVTCFGRVIRELGRSRSDWATYIKASSLVLAIFVVCFLPAGVLHFLHYVRLFADRTESLYVHFNLAVCLCCLHACLDPFLFLVMSKSAGSRLYFMTFKGKTLSVSV